MSRFPASFPATLLAALLCSPVLAQGPAATEPAAPDAEAETVKLTDIEVTADGSQVELPQPYAGGQVATGGRVGLFGNLDMMDTPFNSTNYTAELIKNQQARSMADVVQNDPGVRVARGFGNFQELYFIRGFPVYSDDMAYNGLYGILPRQYTAAEFLERVEVFRGANSFLNGAAPGGSGIGGSINLVPKRAPDQALTRLTLGYENAEQQYSAADVARRFGDDGAWGLRVNAVRRDGETSIDNEDRELSVVSVGTDYRGQQLRLSADFGWQDYALGAPRPSVTPATRIPRLPEASANFAQDWTVSAEKDLFAAVRGEYDLGKRTTVWLATGVRKGEEDNVLANPTLKAEVDQNGEPTGVADGDTTSSRFDNTREDLVTTSEIGVRTELQTGAVGHRLSASAASFKLDSKNAFAFYLTPFDGNLYQPQAVPPSEGAVFPGGDLGDPQTTAITKTSSIALADTLVLLERRLLVTLGARYQTIEQYGYNYDDGARNAAYDESTVTPVFGVVFKTSDQVSLYGNYIESLAPGETVPQFVGDTPVANGGEIFDPFKARQVELGAKYDGGKLAASAALFRTTQPSSRFDGSSVNTDGEQRNQGFELSAFGEPLPGLRVLGGATLIDAELVKTEGGANDGNEPIGVPELQLNAGVEWDLPQLAGLSVDSRVVYTDAQSAAENNALEIPSWTRLDVGARYAFALGGQALTLRA
ncbi:MAG TPA: TonB-dependent siderophore receptor, partial [Fontimonas sp.]